MGGSQQGGMGGQVIITRALFIMNALLVAAASLVYQHISLYVLKIHHQWGRTCAVLVFAC